MLRKARDIGLGALLGLGACSFAEQSLPNPGFKVESRDYGSFTPSNVGLNSSQKNYDVPNNRNSSTSSSGGSFSPFIYSSSNNPISHPLDHETTSANLGPFEISVSPSGDAIRAKLPLPILPSLELPMENGLFAYRRDNLGMEFGRGSNYVFSEFDSFQDQGDFRDSYEEQLMSTRALGGLGKVLRKYLFDNVKPLREASETLQSPVTAVFGEGAKFEVFQRDQDFWAGLKFSGVIDTKYPINYGLNLQASESGRNVFSFDMSITH